MFIDWNRVVARVKESSSFGFRSRRVLGVWWRFFGIMRLYRYKLRVMIVCENFIRWKNICLSIGIGL